MTGDSSVGWRRLIVAVCVPLTVAALFVRCAEDTTSGPSRGIVAPPAVRRGATVARVPARPAGTTEAPLEIHPWVPFLGPVPGYATVTCRSPIPAVDEMRRGRLAPDAGGGLAWLIQDEFVAQVLPGAGAASFEFDELMTGTVEWPDVAEGGAVACGAISVQSLRTGIHGTVVGVPWDWDRASVRGCGGSAEVKENAFFMLAEAPSECELRVTVADDDGWAEGPALLVRTVVHEDAVVTLRYPSEDEYTLFTQDEKLRHDAALRKFRALEQSLRASPKIPEIE